MSSPGTVALSPAQPSMPLGQPATHMQGSPQPSPQGAAGGPQGPHQSAPAWECVPAMGVAGAGHGGDQQIHGTDDREPVASLRPGI